jgi:hypothetical protein
LLQDFLFTAGIYVHENKSHWHRTCLSYLLGSNAL